MNLGTLQYEVSARWSRQVGNPCHTSADANHALVHLMKALGKVASALNDAEHEHRQVRSEDVSKYLADLVICSMRFAKFAGVDMSQACEDRLSEKFPI